MRKEFRGTIRSQISTKIGTTDMGTIHLKTMILPVLGTAFSISKKNMNILLSVKCELVLDSGEPEEILEHPDTWKKSLRATKYLKSHNFIHDIWGKLIDIDVVLVKHFVQKVILQKSVTI